MEAAFISTSKMADGWIQIVMRNTGHCANAQTVSIMKTSVREVLFQQILLLMDLKIVILSSRKLYDYHKSCFSALNMKIYQFISASYRSIFCVKMFSTVFEDICV